MGLRVLIDARIQSGVVGGVEQIVLGTARALSELTDSGEEYVFLTADDGAWLAPYIGGNCRIVSTGANAQPQSFRATLRDRIPLLHKLWHRASPLLGRRSVRFVDGSAWVAEIKPDVVHFVIQTGFLTSVPSLFTPFDLQHLYYPHYFTNRERHARELLYRTFCDQAETVIAPTEWGRQDLIRHLGISPAKIEVVPQGNILTYYPEPTEADLEATRQRLQLPEQFVYFPGQTYPSKNHIGLIRALAALRDRGVIVPLVCSGRMSDHYAEIAHLIRALKLDDQVKFVGFVSALEVQCLYRLSRGLVFPTLFEGWGQPVIEGFYAGIPVACSTATCLPEVASEAALLFDPSSTEAIADAVLKIWQDEPLRTDLIERGKKRAALFTWERTAHLFRAHYRRLARQPLTQEDIALLKAPFPTS